MRGGRTLQLAFIMRSGLSDDSLVTDDEKNTNSVCLFLCSAGPCFLLREREGNRKGGEMSTLRKTPIRHVLNYFYSVISLLTLVTITASLRERKSSWKSHLQVLVTSNVSHSNINLFVLSFFYKNRPVLFAFLLTLLFSCCL